VGPQLRNWKKKKHLKFFFSKTSKPVKIQLGTNHPWVKEFIFSSNIGSVPHQRGDDHKNAKLERGYLQCKNLLENHWARKAQIYIKIPLTYCKFNFLEIMVPGGHTMGKIIFTCVPLQKKSFR
jgi:hypothetical protein